MKKPTKIKPYKSYSKIFDSVWELFSKYIRLKNADWRGYVVCYTCGETKHYKEMQAGHYKHRKLDFDERNIHPQCPRCNKWLRGNLTIYAVKLEIEYGAGILQQLEKDSAKYLRPKRKQLLLLKEEFKKKLMLY